MLQFPFNMFPHDHLAGSFNTTYRCNSVSMMPGQERQDLEKGGKIILPPSALDHLTRIHVQYPMLFKLTNRRAHRETHCGVLEFVADEGKVYLPYWMMTNMLLEEGDIVNIENVSLPVATFAKFQPQSTDFLDIANPKAVLENALRNFACLTNGDMIAINYNDRIYELRVMETKPRPAVSIIECDMSVDFAPAVGYEEPVRRPRLQNDDESMAVDVTDYCDSSKFRVFGGQGNRLDGKTKTPTAASDAEKPAEVKRGIPNYDYKRGKITFNRATRQINGTMNGKDSKDGMDFSAFSGEGHSLRKKSTHRT